MVSECSQRGPTYSENAGNFLDHSNVLLVEGLLSGAAALDEVRAFGAQSELVIDVRADSQDVLMMAQLVLKQTQVAPPAYMKFAPDPGFALSCSNDIF